MILNIGILLALLLCLAGGVVTARNIRLIEYTSRRSSASVKEIVATLVGTLVGGFMFFGLPAIGYEAGIAGIALGFGYLFGLLLIAATSKKLKLFCTQYNIDTIDDLIRVKYGHLSQKVSSAVNLTVFLAILAAQFIAMDAFLKVFTTIHHDFTLFTAAAVTIAYTALAGFKGVLFTDAWQTVIFSVGVAVMAAVTALHTSFRSLDVVPVAQLTGAPYGVSFLIGAMVLFPFSLLCRSDIWQRISCASDFRALRRGILFAAPLLFVFYVLLTGLGVAALIDLGPERRTDTAALVNFMRALDLLSGTPGLSVALTLVLAVGVFAALLSTIDSYLNLVATSIAKVLNAEKWEMFEKANLAGRGMEELEISLLKSTRILSVLLGVFGLLIALMVPDIVTLLVGAISILFVLLPSVLHAIWGKSRTTNSIGSIASMVAGVAAYAAAYLSLPNSSSAFLPAVGVAFFTFYCIHFCGASQESAVL